MVMHSQNYDEELAESHEINVTPFIDVMLVLLIIFMIAAPLATVDIKVDLPASNSEKHQTPDTPVYLTVKKNLTIALKNKIILHENLRQELDQATKNNTDKRLFLRADKTVAYGDLMLIMNDLRDAGYLKIALVALESARVAGAVTP